MKIRVALLGLLLLFTIVPGMVASSLFNARCENGGITFSFNKVPVIWVKLTDISTPLSIAVATGQHQRIYQGKDISLWALASGELQIHFDADPDGTKYVVNAGICGQVNLIFPQNTPGTTTALAVTSGSARAYASALPGQTFAFAESLGSGQAYAFAQSSTSSPSPLPHPANRIHIVQRGENLFRISLRYNTTVSTLAAINNIADPRRIYAGQQLIIP